MNEKPKRKLGWRLLRWGLIGLAVLGTLAALLVTEENWRSKRAWENYQREAAARGEQLDLASVIPPAVPDEQNFFCAPIVAETLAHSGGADSDPFRKSAARLNFKIFRGNNELEPTNFVDMTAWQNYFKKFSTTPEGQTNGFPVPAQPGTPAADVLVGLSGYDSALEELRQAAARPAARMPLHYEDDFNAAGTLLPWLATTKRCGQFLKLRIQAELEAGQSAQALADVKLFLRVSDASSYNRFLISELVHIAMLAILQDTIHQSITEHRWSDAQLAELEGELAKEDLLATHIRAMEGEKIFAIDTFERQRLTREMINVVDGGIIITNSLRWSPAAYFYQNQLAFARLHRDYIVPLVDMTNRIAAPAKLREAEAAVAARLNHYSPYEGQAAMLFPAIAKSVEKFAHIQALMDLTRVACTLERFHLANGNYPETLDALAPKLIEKIPHDIINGQPLHYRRTEDGKFLLYSVGWDETDDGGKIFLTKTGREDSKKGDWVWKN